MPAWNGRASAARHWSSVNDVDGIAVCESPGAAPCPGKCLSVENTEPSSPRTAAATRADAASGVAPSTRRWMNESGSGVTSATMPKFTEIPACRTSAARPANAASAAEGSACCSSRGPGKVSHRRRETSPPS